MREIYFYKEVCFVRLLKFVHYLYVLGWVYEKYTTQENDG